MNFIKLEDNPGISDLLDLPVIFFPFKYFIDVFGSAFWFSSGCSLNLLEIGNILISGVPGEPAMIHSLKFRKFALKNGYSDGWYLSHCGGWFGYVLDEKSYREIEGYEEAVEFVKTLKIAVMASN